MGSTSSGEIDKSSLADQADIFIHTKKPRLLLRKNKKAPLRYCFACGRKDGFKFLEIINDELAAEWGLDESMRLSFDIRESTKCLNCGSSLRSNLHARTICQVLAPGVRNLAEAVNNKAFRKLRIAEINYCGALHKIIANLPNLHYSEYKPDNPAVRHEDLNKLSYKTNSFDAVLTSETLEHVPDWHQAKQEIHRVLRRGGQHIFTTPTILTRRTRSRAYLKGGKIIKTLPPSYHGYNRARTDDYLVFNEFGADMRKSIDQIGFRTELYYRNILRLSDPNFVYVSTKI